MNDIHKIFAETDFVFLCVLHSFGVDLKKQEIVIACCQFEKN